MVDLSFFTVLGDVMSNRRTRCTRSRQSMSWHEKDYEDTGVSSVIAVIGILHLLSIEHDQRYRKGYDRNAIGYVAAAVREMEDRYLSRDACYR